MIISKHSSLEDSLLTTLDLLRKAHSMRFFQHLLFLIPLVLVVGAAPAPAEDCAAQADASDDLDLRETVS